ncbi:MAG: hypothetical protein IJP70_11285 [Bacteroidales bacterium]|nr:hypothetical protein [Bacteroidales bacterium]
MQTLIQRRGIEHLHSFAEIFLLYDCLIVKPVHQFAGLYGLCIKVAVHLQKQAGSYIADLIVSTHHLIVHGVQTVEQVRRVKGMYAGRCECFDIFTVIIEPVAQVFRLCAGRLVVYLQEHSRTHVNRSVLVVYSLTVQYVQALCQTGHIEQIAVRQIAEGLHTAVVIVEPVAQSLRLSGLWQSAQIQFVGQCLPSCRYVQKEGNYE